MCSSISLRFFCLFVCLHFSANGIEFLSRCLLAIGFHLLWSVSLNLLPIFYLVVTIFSLICSVLYIFCILFFVSYMCCIYIFSQYVACCFTLIIVSLDEGYFKFQCSRMYSVCSFMVSYFCIMFKRSFPILQFQRYSRLSFESCVVLIFTFRFSIDFCVWCEEGVEFPFCLSMDCQFCECLKEGGAGRRG